MAVFSRMIGLGYFTRVKLHENNQLTYSFKPGYIFCFKKIFADSYNGSVFRNVKIQFWLL